DRNGYRIADRHRDLEWSAVEGIAFLLVGMTARDGEHAVAVRAGDRAGRGGAVSPIDGGLEVAGRVAAGRNEGRHDDVGERVAFHAVQDESPRRGYRANDGDTGSGYRRGRLMHDRRYDHEGSECRVSVTAADRENTAGIGAFDGAVGGRAITPVNRGH